LSEDSLSLKPEEILLEMCLIAECAVFQVENVQIEEQNMECFVKQTDIQVEKIRVVSAFTRFFGF
jgi:hypothetical protein